MRVLMGGLQHLWPKVIHGALRSQLQKVDHVVKGHFGSDVVFTTDPEVCELELLGGVFDLQSHLAR